MDNNMDNIERQKQHFDSIADRYRLARRTANHLLIKHLIWSDFLEKHTALKRDGLSVLEGMCGFADGKDVLEHTLGVNIIYSGFDYSDTVVDHMRKTHPHIDIRKQDATKFETDRQYDAVMVLGGLHHVPDKAAEVVLKLAAAIRPGGYFINLEPTSGNWLFKTVRELIYNRNSLFDAQTERGSGIDELFGMFERAGLSRADVTYPGLLAYILYYNPDAFPFLNIGGARTVKTIYGIDRLFTRTSVGRALSFATLSLWRKPDPAGGANRH